MPYRRRGRTARRQAGLIGLGFLAVLLAIVGGLAWFALHSHPDIARGSDAGPYSGSSDWPARYRALDRQGGR